MIGSSRIKSSTVRLGIGQALGLVLVVLWLGVGPARAGYYLYGDTEVTVTLYQYDPTTGQTLGSVPILGTAGGLRDIISDNNGQLLLAGWGTTGDPGGDDDLFRLNPASGQTTLIGAITDGAGHYFWTEGMVWVNGTLYASASEILPTNPPTYLGYAPDASNLFIKIDPTTGHATVIGAFGPDYLNVQNLAYSPKYGLIGSDIGTLNPDPNQPNGTFSSYHTTPALIRIDPTTGQVTKIADMPHGGLITDPYNSYLSPSGPYLAGLTFSADGATLYGATIQTHFGGTSSGLVTVDPLTGAMTPIATVAAPVLLGIALLPVPEFQPAVPEPSGFVLLGLGLLGLGLGARSRGR